MKKNIYITEMFILVLVFSLFLPSLFSPSAAFAQSGSEVFPPGPPAPTKTVYLPFLERLILFGISGKVLDSNNLPIPGVRIVDQDGRAAMTDPNGRYQFTGLPAGIYNLAPNSAENFFSPAFTTVNLPGPSTDINFIAATCKNPIKNGGFEQNEAWQFPATAYTAGYDSNIAYTGYRSARTGITKTAQNIFSYSDGWQTVAIPANSTSAKLRMWLLPQSEDVGANAQIVQPQLGTVWNTSTDLGADAQYVLILDPDNYKIQEYLLWWQPHNNANWQYVEFNLLHYAGKSVRIQFGTFNNGKGGVTSLHVDDVSIEVCSDPEEPPEPTCQNYITNYSFEDTLAWYIPITPFPAGYTSTRARTGLRSMRTGVPYGYPNTYSYSDAGQVINVPDNATSIKVSMWVYRNTTQVELQSEIEIPPIDSVWGESVLSSDVQYVLALNDKNSNILQYLMWELGNDSGWVHRQFTLDPGVYRGKRIRLQFGTYNNGTGGLSSMYVDDVMVDICTDGEPPIPPPVNCTDLIANGKFNTNQAWYIPITAYSAGYSSYLYRSAERSMRTGIYYTAHNRFSYSDFRQGVSIPYNIKSAWLKTHLYPMSEEPSNLALPEQPATQTFGELALSGDVQYILVLDKWMNWIGTLHWTRKNTHTWSEMSFDLAKYAGDTIYLQFGTYNNGYGGVTSMYVDDVSLEVCPK